jgi:formamidopyrimidine-DNA glycosylase
VPELPETETIARDLSVALRGAVVRSVQVARSDVLRGTDPAGLAARTEGVALARWWRRAKAVVADLATGDHLVVVPRFTGALLVLAPPLPDDPYACLTFGLADGRALRYRDVRRLGTVALLDHDGFERWSAGLGPEPLDPELTAERFSVLVRSSDRAVKTLLMDQKRVAGVGNIYANEALFRAGVRPTRRGSAVTRREAADLLAALRDVLTASIALRGTSFRDYRDAHGARGGFVPELRVYGRAGAPCLACGTVLRSHHRLEGRVTVFCASCQR